MLDTNMRDTWRKKRFFFDKRWLAQEGVIEVIKTAWESEVIGSIMFKVTKKIEAYKRAMIR